VAAVLIALVLIRVSLRLIQRSHDFLVGAWTGAAGGPRGHDIAGFTQPLRPADEQRVRAFLLDYSRDQRETADARAIEPATVHTVTRPAESMSRLPTADPAAIDIRMLETFASEAASAAWGSDRSIQTWAASGMSPQVRPQVTMTMPAVVH
jgi:hypothetical protein